MKPIVFELGGKQYQARRWAGERLLPLSNYLAFDTETSVVELDRFVPQLAMLSVSAGGDIVYLVHPDDVSAFLRGHHRLRFAAHNVAFDFWVLVQHLRERRDTEVERLWWTVAESNRLHDSMLLDMLVRLAETDTYPVGRNLGEVADEYTGLTLDKNDPFRRRYAEVLGRDWNGVEQGFFTYAAKDAAALQIIYPLVRQRACRTLAAYGEAGDIRADARAEFGLLSESVQIKKAIALTEVTRTGLSVDLAMARATEAERRAELLRTVADVQALAPIYKTDKDGNFVFSGKSHTPAVNQAALHAKLEAVRAELEKEQGTPLVCKKTTKGITRAVKHWEALAYRHPFLAAWIKATNLAKLLQFFNSFQGEIEKQLLEVHPRYNVLVRTGRTSCSAPNIQQIPRDSAFRQLFRARSGYHLLAVDYSFIELRTLAAVTTQRYGRSDMADVIKAGVDPHAHTAAMMLNVPMDEFSKWKDSDDILERLMQDGKEIVVRKKDRYSHGRQAAKAVNFGVPGGLGVNSLVAYAKNTYKVQFSEAEARERRDRLTKQVYKELDLYLAEDAPSILACNLLVPVELVRAEMGDIHLSCVRKILEGDPHRVDGQPYSPYFVSRVWDKLAGLNRNRDLNEALEQRQAGKELAQKVCHGGVVTLTGRLRGRVTYSQVRNTPFQGLAADGAALALFELVREGFRVVGFVHDEVLVELPDEGGYVSEAKVRRVEQVMCEAMAKVLVGDIPVACESTLSERWSKKAKLVVKDGKVYPWKPDGGK